MNTVVEQMLKKYKLTTYEDYENALKEIVQKLVLLSLWRSKFYEKAAFYGGSALHIFYGLNRFSEDLDFSLIKPNHDFDLDYYLRFVQKELNGFGFSFDFEKKIKSRSTGIDSAFLRGDSIRNFLNINADGLVSKIGVEGKIVRIKLEIDIDPPEGAVYEMKTLLSPIPFQVKLFRPQCLFAGKLHAILCRNWKNRVKGRDYYDFVWFIGEKIQCDIGYLKTKLIKTGTWSPTEVLTKEKMIKILTDQFKRIDFDMAKNDVRPFIEDQNSLDLWCVDFFIRIANSIDFI